jgi:hypothetical protein
MFNLIFASGAFLKGVNRLLVAEQVDSTSLFSRLPMRFRGEVGGCEGI